MPELPPPLDPRFAIHDPVHGRVWLTPTEIAIVNTPEFQRLRHIGQITPVDHVFPGTTHNRFAHSIGVMHIMGRVLSQRDIMSYFSTPGRELYIPLVRLAALLHDVGHLPFSHVGEMAWNATRNSGRAFAYTSNDGARSVFDVAAGARPKPAVHEELSALVIRYSSIADVIDDGLPSVNGTKASDLVAKIVEGADTDLVVRNLLSSELDCDRLDYLLRDSLYAGLVYGHIDLDYLIGNLITVEEEAQPGNGPAQRLLAIDRRHGLVAGEHFLMARYYHYAQFISHKTVAAAEVDMVAGMIELIRLERLPLIDRLLGGPATERLAQLRELTDFHVLELLRDAATDTRVSDELREAAVRLFERKLLKTAARDDRLEELPRPPAPPRHPWDVRLKRDVDKLAVAEGCDIDPSRFCYRRSALPLSGIPGEERPSTFATPAGADTVRRGLIKAAKVGGNGEPLRLLIEESPILRGLSKQQWATRRIFVREPLDSYHPRRASDEFTRLKQFFADELRDS